MIRALTIGATLLLSSSGWAQAPPTKAECDAASQTADAMAARNRELSNKGELDKLHPTMKERMNAKAAETQAILKRCAAAGIARFPEKIDNSKR